MSEEKKYRQPSRPTHTGNRIFSDDDSGSFLTINIWNNNTYLEFEKPIVDGQSLKIKSFMSPIKMVEFMSVLKSFYEERLVYFSENKSHKDIHERVIQIVKNNFETKTYDVVSHVKIGLNDKKEVVLTAVKGDLAIPITFSSKQPIISDDTYFTESDKLLLMNLDIKDLGLWNFYNSFKKHLDLIHPMYGLLVTFFEFFIGKKYFDKNESAPSNGANYYQNKNSASMIDNNSSMSIQSYDDGDEF